MKILDRLPITRNRGSLEFGGRYITVHRNQAIVWLSVLPPEVRTPEPNHPVFPALLDSGNNVGLSIQHRHLHEWAGVGMGLCEAIGELEINAQVVTRRAAAVWLYPNIPDCQDLRSGGPPFRLSMSQGIAVYDRDAVPPGPRLPLLGLPAFLENDLDFWLDPDRRQVTVRERSCAGP